MMTNVTGMEWNPSVVSIFIFFMATEVEHFFTYLLATCAFHLLTYYLSKKF
jgi:hypothetical protein